MMELSKLNISSIAKEEIRRRFFDSRSSKNIKSEEANSSNEKTTEGVESNEEDQPKIKKEMAPPIEPQLNEETSASEDDGFPLITSVFSLALSGSGTGGEGSASTEGGSISSEGTCVFRDGISTAATYTTMPLSKNVSVSNQGSIPFVVKCSPSGVITVCSPPNPASNYGMDGGSTTITSSIKGSVCSVESSNLTPTSTNQEMFQDTTTGSPSSSLSGSLPNVVTLATQESATPVEKSRSEVSKYLSTTTSEKLNKNSTVCQTSKQTPEEAHNALSCLQTPLSSTTNIHTTQQRNVIDGTNLVTTETNKQPTVNDHHPISSEQQNNVGTATNVMTNNDSPRDETSWLDEEANTALDSKPLLHTSDDGKTDEVPTCTKDENIVEPVLTKQEQKIRQLKDLLRQKEAEVEKFRFKGESGSVVAAAAQLRANFLKRNPSLLLRSQRVNTQEGTESQTLSSTALLSNKGKELNERDETDFACEEMLNPETESRCSKGKLSEKDKMDVKTSSTPIEKTTKFTNQDKYKLVNVTILQGHTRTLAVPLDSGKREVLQPPKYDSKNEGNNVEKANKGATDTTTRKRKQEMPRKVSHGSSKRKPDNKNCSKDMDTVESLLRRSPRKREGNEVLTTASLKRKSPDCQETKSSDGESASKKVLKNASTPKRIAKVASPPVESINSAKSPEESGVSESQFTIAKSNDSSKPMTGTLALPTNKSTTHSSTCDTSSKPTIMQKAITFNLTYPNKVQTMTNTIGKNIAYILHVKGTGATTDQETTPQFSVSSDDAAKQKKECMQNQVFALVGKVPGSGKGNDGSKMNASVFSSTAGAATIQANQAKLVNPTSAPNNLVSSTRAPMASIPLRNVQPNAIGSDFGRLGIVGQPKVVIPVNIGGVNCPTVGAITSQVSQQPDKTRITTSQSTIPLVKNILMEPQANTSCKSPTVFVPHNLTTTKGMCGLSIPENLGVSNTQLISSVTTTVSVPAFAPVTTNEMKNTPYPSVNTLKVGNPTAAVVGEKNRQTDSNQTTRSLAENNVKKVVSPLKSILTSTSTTRPLAPKPGYPPTVPVSVASMALKKVRKVRSPKKKAKVNRLVNLTSRSLAPKPSVPRILIPRLSLHRNEPPTSKSPKPTALQGTTTNPPPSTTTSSVTIAQKLTSTQTTSPTPHHPMPTTSQQLNQVIYTLSKPVMAVPTETSPALPQNFNNGKILVYDVVQTNMPKDQGDAQNPPAAANDPAKLVVYVANSGETRNLGIIRDNKIYLNTNQVTAIAQQPGVKSPVATSVSEFIPNPGDGDFRVLLGLEHVVNLLT